MTRQLGLMQGRLSPPWRGRFQAFPADTWRSEFAAAAACGLQRIEWIVDDPDWETNPLLHEEGRLEIARLASESGVQVRSACADLFMPNPLHSCPDDLLARRAAWLERIIDAAGAAGLEHVDVPFVDASAIRDDRAFETTAAVLRLAALRAADAGLKLCLETALEPARFRVLLEAIGHPSVGANHDIGNSASLGYAPADEFRAIGPWVSCVHIKDRRRGGGTVPLGTGDADFPAAFEALQRAGYAGHFILQAARGESGDELEWTRANAAFARRWMSVLDGTEVGHGPRS